MIKVFFVSLLFLTILSCNSEPSTEQKLTIDMEKPLTIESTNSKLKGEQHNQIDTNNYEEVEVYKKLRVNVPRTFNKMSLEMISAKYPSSANRPNVVFTNEEGTINIAFTHTNTSISGQSISSLKSELSNQLQSSNVENFSSTIETINGSEYAIFKFVSQAIDTKVYNQMFATELDGRLLLGTFNCVVESRNEWEPRANEIINSLKKD